MSHTDRSAALLQVEHTSYSVGGGAMLDGSIASSSHDLAPPKNPAHENGEKLFKRSNSTIKST